MRTWFSWSLPVALMASGWLASPARAGHRGADEYGHATELHGDRQYEAAAAEFIAAYQAGYREGTSAYNAACGLARAGKTKDALVWLERARDAGFDLESYLDEDSDLRSLRSDPRFAALRSQVLRGKESQHDRAIERVVRRTRDLVGRKDVDSDALDQSGRELLRLGRYDEAAQAFMAAAAHKSFRATSIYNAACARSLKGDKSAALELLQKAVEEGFADPKHLDDDEDLDAIRGEPRFRAIHTLAEELEVPSYPVQPRDRTPETTREWLMAMPRIAAAVRKHPGLGQAWFNLGFAGFALGHLAQAAPSFEKAVELGYRKPTSMYNLACSHAILGHIDTAFDWLETAFANGFDDWKMIRTDDDLKNLRSDPRFEKILDAARAKSEASHKDSHKDSHKEESARNDR